MPLPLGLLLGFGALGTGLDELDHRRQQSALDEQALLEQQQRERFGQFAAGVGTPGFNPMEQFGQGVQQGGFGLDPNQRFSVLQELLAGQQPVDPLEGSFRDDIINPETGIPESVLFSRGGDQLRNLGQSAFPPAASASVSINNEKPLGGDIVNFVGPDGETLTDPGMTATDVQALGGRVKTNVEKKAEETEAGLEGVIPFLDREVKRAQTEFNKAQEALDKNRSIENIRRFNNASAALQSAIAGRNNPRGEPSGDVLKGVNTPNVLEGIFNSANQPGQNVIDFNDLPKN